MRETLRPRHSLVALLTAYLRLLTLFVMLSVLFPSFQVVFTAVWTLILQTFQMWLQTTRRQLYYAVTEARHGFYLWRVHVSARRTTVWTLLYLAIAKLTPLKLQYAFFAYDFFALIAHLSVV